MKTKPHPYLLFTMWAWCAGWALTAHYYAQDGVWSKPRARFVRMLGELGMDVLSPLWWWA